VRIREGVLARWPGLPVFAVTDAMKPIHAHTATRPFEVWWEQGVRLVATDDVLAERCDAPAERIA
jgi:hypothetical protein